MSDPFATAADLEAVWRPLTDAEEDRADALLARASRMIRRRWSNVDDRITSGDLDADEVSDVVLEMVQTAMTTPTLGVSQESQTAGPYNHSVKYDNPAGRLYFSKWMVELFDGLPTAVRRWLA